MTKSQRERRDETASTGKSSSGRALANAIAVGS